MKIILNSTITAKNHHQGNHTCTKKIYIYKSVLKLNFIIINYPFI